MQILQTELRNKLVNAQKIAILGIGSELMGDDAVGVIIAKQLQNEYSGNDKKIKVFIGETAPENLTGEMKKYNPSHLLIIDAADFGKEAGFTAVIDLSQIGGISFSTHRLPTKIIADYLSNATGCKAIAIGIQPKQMGFCTGISKEIERTIEKILKAIKEVLN